MTAPPPPAESSPHLHRINTHVLCDQTGLLTVFYSSKDYPAALRRIVDEESGKRVTFLTNNQGTPAKSRRATGRTRLTAARSRRGRWAN